MYSHYPSSSSSKRDKYSDNIDCRITFKSADDFEGVEDKSDDLKDERRRKGRLMLRIVELDIPDQSLRRLCNDALYVFDANGIYVFGKAVVSILLSSKW